MNMSSDLRAALFILSEGLRLGTAQAPISIGRGRVIEGRKASCRLREALARLCDFPRGE